MRISSNLLNYFDRAFEEELTQFCLQNGWFEEADGPFPLRNRRWINRSVLPHVDRLRSLFNRLQETSSSEPPSPLESSRYWKQSQNPKNLMLAYFLTYMPCNLFRVASVWNELQRLGFQWDLSSSGQTFRSVEWGAGPGTATAGILTAERFNPTGIPPEASFALIEQDRKILEHGEKWIRFLLEKSGRAGADLRTFPRKIDLETSSFLPGTAPRFHLGLMSFFLNELASPPEKTAAELLVLLEKHIEENGLLLIVEPALKSESRKLLEIRSALLRLHRKQPRFPFRCLLPCLGEQACGALAQENDWCHEDARWVRPHYLRSIDEIAGFHHQSLPFSYLVLARSNRSVEELLPGLASGTAAHRYRLVSPAHYEGHDQEFFICGQDGKRRARFRTEHELSRGDILNETILRGAPESTRIDQAEVQNHPDPKSRPE